MDVRIDKWLWAVRLFKTRSLAADAFKKNKVLMHGQAVKASKTVAVGDVVQIKHSPIVYSFKVLALSQSRMNAKLVPNFMQHVTTPDQIQLLEMVKLDKTAYRERGTGRPTKKERRDLDCFAGETPFFLDDADNWNFNDD